MSLTSALDEVYETSRVLDVEIAAELAEVERPSQEARLAKWRITRAFEHLMDSVLQPEGPATVVPPRIRIEIEDRFDRLADEIASIASDVRGAKMSGGYHELGALDFTIGWEHFSLVRGPNTGYVGIYIRLPDGSVKEYESEHPNSPEVLKQILAFIKTSPEYQRFQEILSTQRALQC